MRFLRAIIAGIKRLASLAVGVAKSPLDLLLGLLGAGGAVTTDRDPEFIAPGSTSDLVAEMQNGHKAKAAEPSLESQAITAIYKMRNGRSTVNLSAVERRDVQDLLIGMSQEQIESLCRAGRHAIIKLLKTGDSGVYGVPMTEIARLRHVRAEMAKPKPSMPFVMPAT